MKLLQTGSLLRFTFRNVHVFEVAESFPRLPDDYMPPLGVTGIKYSINVGSLPSLDVTDVRQILEMVRSGTLHEVPTLDFATLTLRIWSADLRHSALSYFIQY